MVRSGNMNHRYMLRLLAGAGTSIIPAGLLWTRASTHPIQATALARAAQAHATGVHQRGNVDQGTAPGLATLLVLERQLQLDPIGQRLVRLDMHVLLEDAGHP